MAGGACTNASLWRFILTSTTLTSRDIREGRLNWHPAVHRAYDEDLYYVAIRFLQGRGAASSVTELMSDAEIEFYSAYTIYGYFDAIIRYWATPQRRHDFLRNTMQHKPEILVFREFQASEIYYSWDPATKFSEDLLSNFSMDEVREAIAESRPLIEMTARQPSKATQAVEKLISRGLLIEKPSEPRTSMKVLVSLQSLSPQLEGDYIASRLLQGLQAIPTLVPLSLYAGTGDLGSYLIRIGLHSFEQLSEAVDAIERVMAPLPFRTMTMPLSGMVGGTESDNINNVSRLHSIHHAIADVLKIQKHVLEGLDQQSRDRLTELFEKAETQLGRPEPRETGRQFLKGCVTEDPILVRRSLSYILDFEYYFKAYTKHVFEEAYAGTPEGWEIHVKNKYNKTFKNAPENLIKNFDTWPLGILHLCLLESTGDDQYVRANVLHVLGEDWATVSRGVLNLRNAYAHGTLIREAGRLSYLSGDWGDKVEHLLRGMELFTKLYRSVEGED